MKFDKFTVLFLTKSYGGLAQLVRASASHAEGQRFESAALHHHGQPNLMTLRQTQCHQGFPGFLPELMHQSSDRCLTACESVFLNQSVIDPLCGMVLFFGTAVSILIQAPLDEGNDIICNDGNLSTVVLALPGDAVAIPILFVGVAGNVQLTGNLPLILLY